MLTIRKKNFFFVLVYHWNWFPSHSFDTTKCFFNTCISAIPVFEKKLKSKSKSNRKLTVTVSKFYGIFWIPWSLKINQSHWLISELFLVEFNFTTNRILINFFFRFCFILFSFFISLSWLKIWLASKNIISRFKSTIVENNDN